MKNNFSVRHFPIDEYRQAGVSLAGEKETAKKEKEKWTKTRLKLDPKQQSLLDEEFKKTFEKLQNFFYGLSPIEDAELLLEELKVLTTQGAGAGLLDPYELGGFNTAGVVKELPELRTERALTLATEVIRLSIVAGADLAQLKAYAGNGGAPSLYWLCEYLSKGIGPDWSFLKDEFQYASCFRIFCLLLAGAPEVTKKENYCAVFLSRLSPHPVVAAMQREVFLRLLHGGWTPSGEYSSYGMFSGLSSMIKKNSMEWLTLLFPFPEKEIEGYVAFLIVCLEDANSGTILNGFKATREGRKYFNAYFCTQKHWLLSHLLQNHPESIFGLVRGHEQEMLEPFLKHYKKELVALRDKKGNTLLHQAALSGSSPEKIVSLLLKAGLETSQTNQDGETAEDIAQRKKRKLF